jgi:hypothetical protein
MPDFGFVGPSYVAPSIYQDDQECINWYPEVGALKKPGERGVVALYPTPGLRIVASPPVVGEIRGMWVQPGGGTLYVVIANNVYAVAPNFVGPIVGSLATRSGPVSMTDNGASLFLADGAARYAYTWGTGAFVTLTDGAFTTATRVDTVDNYVVYNNPGTNEWGCTDLKATTSNALNFAFKDSSSDNLISLIVNRREVFLLGERTTEVWTDVGTFPFPFGRVAGTTSQHGCLAPASVARLGESFAWLAQDTRGQSVVVAMNGYEPVRISTHAVEQDIQSFGVQNDAIAYSYQQNGHEFYMLTFPSADRTWTYDLTTSMALGVPMWHKRASRDGNNVLHRHWGNCAALFQNQIVIGDYFNGNLYVFDLQKYEDDQTIAVTVPIPRVRRCLHLTDDLKRQFFHDFQIQFQPGVGLQTGQGSDPQAMLRWSDDGGSTWSLEHWKPIGKAGQYKNRCRWPGPLGSARDRIFEVQVSDPIKAVVVSANLNASPGAA